MSLAIIMTASLSDKELEQPIVSKEEDGDLSNIFNFMGFVQPEQPKRPREHFMTEDDGDPDTKPGSVSQFQIWNEHRSRSL